MNPYAMLAADPGITLHITRLPDGEQGRYYPDTDTIVLDNRLTQAERRCTLLHELIHRARQDDPDAPPNIAVRQEWDTRSLTARMLIPIEDYCRALVAAWPNMYEQMADDLNVDVQTLKDRVACLSIDEVSYVSEQVMDAQVDVA